MPGDAAIPHPVLRLTRRPLRIESGPAHDPASWHREARARLAIADENSSASAINADEARRLLAVRVAECLEGGRAAILTPMRRRRVMRLAHMMGVRDFDAHLVIAIVQDGAHRGETPDTATEDARLDLFSSSLPESRTPHTRLAAAGALGAGVLAALLVWFFAP